MKWLAIIFIWVFAGCAEEPSSEPAFTTLDSNVLNLGDSVSADLHTDRLGGDTSFTVAMDSAGKLVTPADTSYRNK